MSYLRRDCVAYPEYEPRFQMAELSAKPLACGNQSAYNRLAKCRNRKSTVSLQFAFRPGFERCGSQQIVTLSPLTRGSLIIFLSPIRFARWFGPSATSQLQSVHPSPGRSTRRVPRPHRLSFGSPQIPQRLGSRVQSICTYVSSSFLASPVFFENPLLFGCLVCTSISGSRSIPPPWLFLCSHAKSLTLSW